MGALTAWIINWGLWNCVDPVPLDYSSPASASEGLTHWPTEKVSAILEMLFWMHSKKADRDLLLKMRLQIESSGSRQGEINIVAGKDLVLIIQHTFIYLTQCNHLAKMNVTYFPMVDILILYLCTWVTKLKIQMEIVDIFSRPQWVNPNKWK